MINLQDFQPLNHKKGTSNKLNELVIGLKLLSKYFVVYASVIERWGLVNNDRVGFILPKDDDNLMVFVYFTSNSRRTRKIKKYRTGGWQFADSALVSLFAKKYKLNPAIGSYKFYIEHKICVKLEVETMIEECYLLVCDPDERADLTPLEKQAMKDEYTRILNQIKS